MQTPDLPIFFSVPKRRCPRKTQKNIRGQQKFRKFVLYLHIKQKTMIDIRAAAKYLIQQYELNYGYSMDEMKLHKLLYFAQRESFVLLGKAMFVEKFEAWKYGPVMRCLRKSSWMFENISSLHPDSEYIRVLDDVLKRYAPMDSWTLSNISHGETCWQKAKDKEHGHFPVEIQTEDIEHDAKVIKYRRLVCSE